MFGTESKLNFVRITQNNDFFITVNEDKGIQVVGFNQDRTIVNVDIEYCQYATFAELSTNSKLLIFTTPKFIDETILNIWNFDRKELISAKELSFDVTNIISREDKLLVASPQDIILLSIDTLEHTFTFPNSASPKGVCAMISKKDVNILAYPCQNSIFIFDIKEIPIIKNVINDTSEVSFMCLSDDGRLIAWADNSGTYITIYSLETNKKIAQVYRGREACIITNMNFSLEGDYLCVSSNKSTVHVFAVSKPELNQSSWVWNEKWSLARYYTGSSSPCVASFNPIRRGEINAISLDGKVHSFAFDDKGNVVNVTQTVSFL